MLEKFLETLCKELSIRDVPKPNQEHEFPFRLNSEIEVILLDLSPGISMNCPLILCPQKNREDLFISLGQANLLGQGTGGCAIGLDANEKFLTLSLVLAYEINYSTFKERFESFVNYVIYWKEEIGRLTVGSP